VVVFLTNRHPAPIGSNSRCIEKRKITPCIFSMPSDRREAHMIVGRIPGRFRGDVESIRPQPAWRLRELEVLETIGT
jgi:hypothetical protein